MPAVHRPIFSLILKKTWGDLYDRMGFLVRLNLLWLIASFGIVTIPSAVTAVYYAVLQAEENGENRAGVFWDGFKKYFWISTLFVFIYLFFVGLVVGGLMFFVRAGGAIRAVGVILETAALWIALLFGCVMIYAPCVIVESKSRMKMIDIWIKCFVAFFAQPWLQARIVTIMILWILLSIWTKILFGVAMMSWGAVLILNTFRLERSMLNGEEIDIPDRNWRQIWKPWEGEKDERRKK